MFSSSVRFVLFPVLLLLARAGRARAAEEGTIKNPLVPWNFADPFVITRGADIYAYATNFRSLHVQVLHSTDWVQWKPLPDALPKLPSWAVPGKTWAPEVAAVPGGWVLYFTTHDRKSGRQAVGAAFAKAPEGPFEDNGAAPLICQDSMGGSIDASPFTDVDGKRWLLWKNDGNAVQQKTWIWLQRLSADGLRLEGAPQKLIQNDAPWEGKVVEAPTLLHRAGTYYLFYSGGNFADATYATGCATAPSLTGPWTKCAANPILHSTGAVSGPGHQHVFADSAGQWWMAYHAWEAGKEGAHRGRRTFRLDRLTFDEKGVPHISPTLTPQAVPARPRP